MSLARGVRPPSEAADPGRDLRRALRAARPHGVGAAIGVRPTRRCASLPNSGMRPPEGSRPKPSVRRPRPVRVPSVDARQSSLVQLAYPNALWTCVLDRARSPRDRPKSVRDIAASENVEHATGRRRDGGMLVASARDPGRTWKM